jgi:putative hydrolase of the HAD superfamily
VIFFDLDNTLLDDDRATAHGLDALHARYALRISRSRADLTAEWMRLIDHYFPRYLSGEMSMQDQRRARIRHIFDADSSPISDVDADEAHRSYIEGYERGWCCFPDVVPTLRRLSQFPFGIITNGNNEQQRKKLERTGLARFFRTVLTSDEFGVAKPNPRIFAEACRRAGVSASKAMFVGDNWGADIEGSRAAGLYPIWIRRGVSKDRVPQTDVATISTLSDLPILIDRLSTFFL